MVMLVILGVLALGVGVPLAVHAREQRAAARVERERADAAAEEEETRRADVARREAEEEAAREREEAEEAVRKDPESHVIPALRRALDKDVHPIQRQIEAAVRARAIEGQTLAALEVKLAALEERTPRWIFSHRGELIVLGLFAFAPVALLAIAALDYTMFQGAYDDPWQAGLYTIVTMVFTTGIGLAAIAVLPSLFNLPAEAPARLRAQLASGVVIAALAVTVGGLWMLAPNRSAATNEATVAQANEARDEILKDKEAGRTYSEESLALRQQELESAEDTRARDQNIDQALVLGMLGVDVGVAEATVLALGYVRPRRRLKDGIEAARNKVDELREDEVRLGEAKTAAARQVGTNVWDYLQAMGVDLPEVVIRDAMSRIVSADPVHYQVLQQGVERYRDIAEPTPGEVVAGEVVGTEPPAVPADLAGDVEEVPVSAVAAEPWREPEAAADPKPETASAAGPTVGHLDIGELNEPLEGDEDAVNPMVDVPDLDDLTAL